MPIKLSEAAPTGPRGCLGCPFGMLKAIGGGCVAGRARVDHGCVRARVVGKRKPHLPQPDAMADASNVRHDTIAVPETMSPAQVRAMTERKAQLESETMTWSPSCISTDHGRSAVSTAPRSTGGTATR